MVALVGAAAEMTSAFAGARKNRLDLGVGIALGSASQIALFVAPVLILASYAIGPTPMDLRFWITQRWDQRHAPDGFESVMLRNMPPNLAGSLRSTTSPVP